MITMFWFQYCWRFSEFNTDDNVLISILMCSDFNTADDFWNSILMTMFWFQFWCKCLEYKNDNDVLISILLTIFGIQYWWQCSDFNSDVNVRNSKMIKMFWFQYCWRFSEFNPAKNDSRMHKAPTFFVVCDHLTSSFNMHQAGLCGISDVNLFNKILPLRRLLSDWFLRSLWYWWRWCSSCCSKWCRLSWRQRWRRRF